MLDVYWTYLTQGVVDITSVISPQAPNMEGLWDGDHSKPPGVEIMFTNGSRVTGIVIPGGPIRGIKALGIPDA